MIENMQNVLSLDSSSSIFNYDNRDRENVSQMVSESRHHFVTSDANNNSGENSYGDTNEIPLMIFRFKFTEQFMLELYNFSKIHQYDHRNDFKDAWKTWTEENSELVDSEIDRLTKLGYEGDIMDKMFKSARYYFRKKSTEKREPKQRRQYISVNRGLLDAMDLHIEENINCDEYQPKSGFIKFCKDNEQIIKQSMQDMLQQGIKDGELIQDKIKKTYKNRYFMLTNKNY